MTDQLHENRDDRAASVPPPGTPSTGEHPHTDFSREDDRWDLKNQARDWFILLIMVAIYLAWTGVVYFFEPGIR